MSRLVANRLGPRIFLYAMAAYTAIAVIVCSWLVEETFRSEKENILRELTIYQDSFNQPLASLLWSMDQERIDVLLDGIVLIPGVVGMRLEDPANHYVLAEKGRIPSSGADGLFGQSSDVVYKEKGQNMPLGRLTLFSANGAVYDRIQTRVMLIVSGAIAQVLFLWLVLDRLIKRLVTRRLSVLTEAVESFDPNKPEAGAAALDLSENDELSTLGRAFQDLRGRLITVLGSLSESQWRLRELNRELEDKVSERTAELAAAKEVAEKANSTKSDFLAAASHDLRQPLHAMSLQIGQLQEMLQEEKARMVLEQLSNSQFALSDTLNALLDISRLDAGTLKPNLTHFPLAQLFIRLENEFTPQARERAVEFRLHPTSAWLYSDPTLLYRILANLVDNAIKHANVPGVLVGARKRADKWRVEVWDCGRGIPQEKQQAIFEEFVQLDNSGRERRKGLGLGLSIVQRLTRLFGYRLTLISDGLHGSCFRLEVPQGEPLAQPECEHPDVDGRGYSLRGAAVLVVEDDPAVLSATRDMLAGWQCAALTAASMDEALEAAQDEEIDAIVADYRLADGHTGVEVIEALQEKQGGQIKALIVTGEVNPEALEKLRSGRYPVLSKPVTPITLRSTLHRMMTDKSGQA